VGATPADSDVPRIRLLDKVPIRGDDRDESSVAVPVVDELGRATVLDTTRTTSAPSGTSIPSHRTAGAVSTVMSIGSPDTGSTALSLVETNRGTVPWVVEIGERHRHRDEHLAYHT
jgi:hypothetical protein